jgi:hypothetical protein
MKGFGILSIDPGVSGTGICVWDSATWGKKFQVKQGLSFSNHYSNPIHVENFMPHGYDNWVITCEKFHEKLHTIINRYMVRRVFCEFPQYFASSKGHAATGKGDIYKLSCLVGVFAGCVWEYGGEFNCILVNEWKGQLSKDAVIQRIGVRLPTLGSSGMHIESHSYDAIGIGLFAQGERFGT